MPAERFRQPEANGREPGAELVADEGQVFHDVLAGREEIGQENHLCRTAFDAECSTCIDGRLGEFQVGRLDVRISAPSTELLANPFEIGIGRRAAAAMSDR